MKEGLVHSLKSAVIIFLSLDLHVLDGKEKLIMLECIVTCYICYSVVFGDSISVEKHLELGKKFLGEGQLSDALQHYSAACGEDI